MTEQGTEQIREFTQAEAAKAIADLTRKNLDLVSQLERARSSAMWYGAMSEKLLAVVKAALRMFQAEHDRGADWRAKMSAMGCMFGALEQYFDVESTEELLKMNPDCIGLVDPEVRALKGERDQELELARDERDRAMAGMKDATAQLSEALRESMRLTAQLRRERELVVYVQDKHDKLQARLERALAPADPAKVDPNADSALLAALWERERVRANRLQAKLDALRKLAAEGVL
jgi:hypothetical protein